MLAWKGSVITSKPVNNKFFKKFITTSKKELLEIYEDKLVFENTIINVSDIIAIILPSKIPKLITKSNYRILLELADSWFYIYAVGIKYYPDIEETNQIIKVVKKYFSKKINVDKF